MTSFFGLNFFKVSGLLLFLGSPSSRNIDEGSTEGHSSSRSTRYIFFCSCPQVVVRFSLSLTGTTANRILTTPNHRFQRCRFYSPILQFVQDPVLSHEILVLERHSTKQFWISIFDILKLSKEKAHWNHS